MGEVLKDGEAVRDDLMGFLAMHVGDKANSAGISVVAAVVKTFCGFEIGAGRACFEFPPACCRVFGLCVFRHVPLHRGVSAV